MVITSLKLIAKSSDSQINKKPLIKQSALRRYILQSLVSVAMVASASYNSPNAYAEVSNDDMISAVKEWQTVPVFTPANQGFSDLKSLLTGAKYVTSIPLISHILLLDLDAQVPTPSIYRNMIEQTLGSNGVVVLRGTTEKLQQLKPSWIRVWPDTNVIVLSSHSGIGVHGMQLQNPEDLSPVLQLVAKQIRMSKVDDKSQSMTRSTRSGTVQISAKNTGIAAKAARPPMTKGIDAPISEKTPSNLCSAFGNEVYKTFFKDTVATKVERDAIALEVGKWCQYGTVNNYQAAPPERAVPGWPYFEKPLLTIDTEWALVKSLDYLKPVNSKYYLWVKTIGEGAGNGFTRNPIDTGYFKNNAMYNILDASIHSGWGITYPQDKASWREDEVDLYECEFAVRESRCPTSPKLIRLFPSDSFTNMVTVANATALKIGGTATLTGGITPTGPTASLAGQFVADYTTTSTNTATVNLMNTQTNANKKFFRSTRWKPDVAAIWDYWVARGKPDGPIGSATPLASTLNPQYDMLWSIPIAGNQGKFLPYNLVYEARWNYCVKFLCTAINPPQLPDSLPPQQRVYWTQKLFVDLREPS